MELMIDIDGHLLSQNLETHSGSQAVSEPWDLSMCFKSKTSDFLS